MAGSPFCIYIIESDAMDTSINDLGFINYNRVFGGIVLEKHLIAKTGKRYRSLTGSCFPSAVALSGQTAMAREQKYEIFHSFPAQDFRIGG